MEKNKQQKNQPSHNSHRHHQGLLAHLVSYSPVVFFVVLVLGMVLHVNFPIPFIAPVIGWVAGLTFLIISPVLIIWAQQVRHTLSIPVEDRTCGNFHRGPYKLSRNPTYLSLFFLLFGLSLLVNSLTLFVMTIGLGPLFTFVIVPEEERLLQELCGSVYIDYKKKVGMWF